MDESDFGPLGSGILASALFGSLDDECLPLIYHEVRSYGDSFTFSEADILWQEDWITIALEKWAKVQMSHFSP